MVSQNGTQMVGDAAMGRKRGEDCFLSLLIRLGAELKSLASYLPEPCD